MTIETGRRICIDCLIGFEFPKDEREAKVYRDLGLNPPRRCEHCRRNNRLRKEWRERGRETYDALCSDCGQWAVVPFQPQPGRPIYCYECHAKRYPDRHETNPGR